MVTATFRFYDELGDFLPRERRGRDFSSPCARAATVKHMVEALGVPHTEVGLILVDGESSGFERLLEEGDRVAVYPAFSTLDVTALTRVPRLSPGEQQAPPRFVADAHLGGLARLLRMAGFDTLYDNHYGDDEIVAIAADEDRVVLTRDRELLKRRAVVQGCYLHAIKPAEQFRELYDRLALAASARPFSLCLHCNLALRAVDKAFVLDALPPSVRELHDEFHTCDACRRVFWKGSHHKRMCALLDAVAGAARVTEGGAA
ncbi:Mut7-C RNAse domain-containing protein [Massilia sp. YIM B02769]|uniref:Mut7-C RNAse domain-containing protein n=1 Tax=Massilia sp. YIM B02769 TaxID=3050129 RepID=UPI0025B70320|nr:Mut7-C RNAse domain-containing protein [Massilia sp. YIM B02769]MDN4060900.1 Mut7-C RNAse domain-containing protein [Massilia sp. YIM B02769]